MKVANIARDITKRKQAAEALSESEERFRELFDNAPVGYHEFDVEGRITRVNQTELEMLGYPPEEMIGKPIWNFIVEEESRESVLKKLSGLIPPGKSFERTCRRKDGATFPVLIEDRLLLDSGGKIAGIRATLQDITRLKQAEVERSIAHHRLLNIIEFLPDATFAIDHEKRVVSWNRAIEEMTGVKKGEVIGKGDYEYALPFYGQRRPMLIDFIFSEDRDAEKSYLSIKKKDGKFFAESFLPSFPSKKGIFLWEVASPLFDRNGNLAGAIQSVRDITDQKRTYIQLLHSEKMASIGQLAAGVAHEINNPIGFVSSNLNTLTDFFNDIQSLILNYRNLMKDLKDEGEKGKVPASILTKVDLILMKEGEFDMEYILREIPGLIKESSEGTERVKKIVQDLKNFTHPGDEKLKPVDLNKNLESTLSVVWNELKYKATVKREYGDIPEVQCYPQQLNQVFMNILVNAAQAIEEKGEIRIRTNAHGDHVEVLISDTGVGIPPEYLPRIFDPFFTTKEVGKGTGLGLNVAYSLIKKHHGSIHVKSTVGKGTIFVVRIPIKPPSSAEEKVEVP